MGSGDRWLRPEQGGAWGGLRWTSRKSILPHLSSSPSYQTTRRALTSLAGWRPLLSSEAYTVALASYVFSFLLVVPHPNPIFHTHSHVLKTPPSCLASAASPGCLAARVELGLLFPLSSLPPLCSLAGLTFTSEGGGVVSEVCIASLGEREVLPHCCGMLMLQEVFSADPHESMERRPPHASSSNVASSKS